MGSKKVVLTKFDLCDLKCWRCKFKNCPVRVFRYDLKCRPVPAKNDAEAASIKHIIFALLPRKVKRSAVVQACLNEIWKGNDLTTNNWLFSYWLLKKQLQEIEDRKFDAQVFLNEYADIAIIVIHFFMHLGLDPEKVLLERLKTRHKGRTKEIEQKYNKMWVEEQVKRSIAVEIPKDEIVKVARALMPPPAKRQALFEKLWQSLVAYAQFGNRDFQVNMAKYVRTLDPAYLADAKLHLSDSFCQLFLMCEFYNIDVSEVIKLGVERLKNHWKQEMLKEFKEYYE